MDFLNNIYNQTLAENEKNLRFWEDYLQNLTSLDLSIHAEKLKVPALVPVGSRILFRGQIKHTNEVTVALGADYFAKCSIKQAEVLRQHRIQDAKSRVDAFQKERIYLANQFSFTKQNVFEDKGNEIFENFNEDEDKLWRQRHRENMKLYKQKKNKEESKENNVTDEELWERLEELELQEELENQLQNMSQINSDGTENSEKNDYNKDIFVNGKEPKLNKPEPNFEEIDKKVLFSEVQEDRTVTSKLDLLQKVIEKQNELEEKLNELKYKERNQGKTEKDLIAKLDEMEEIDELEDEMERLDDILGNEDAEEESLEDREESKSQAGKIKRRVSFADEDEGETLELTFTHSDNNPNIDPYDPEKGILKPSDLYEAYETNFTETTSILKKSKYGGQMKSKGILKTSETLEDHIILDDGLEFERTIVMKDVTEKNHKNLSQIPESTARPTSLFKMRRQQK